MYALFSQHKKSTPKLMQHLLSFQIQFNLIAQLQHKKNIYKMFYFFFHFFSSQVPLEIMMRRKLFWMDNIELHTFKQQKKGHLNYTWWSDMDCISSTVLITSRHYLCRLKSPKNNCFKWKCKHETKQLIQAPFIV